MPVAQQDQELCQSLAEQIAQARSQTDALFSIVRPQFLYERPIAERHRIVFYIGHLESFDWNLLSERTLSLRPFNPEYDRLFAFGIDPVDGGLPTDQPSDWPKLDAVRSYVARIRGEIDSALERAMVEGCSEREFPLAQLLHVALEHRLMHAETLAYMFHQLPLDQKIRNHPDAELATAPQIPSMVPIPAGAATLGLPRHGPVFGWDNEFEQHRIDVPAFAIDRYPVTNAEFLTFVNAGGYQNKAHWLEADWKWVSENRIEHPGFWRHQGNTWKLRTMFDEIPLPESSPVYVSQAEAAAFARWAGKALPTEAQWHRAAFGTPEGSEREFPWGSAAPDPRYGNFDFQRWNPTPVNAHPAGDSAFGVSDLIGNGWEWTSTLFAPFPGFEPFPFYLGYSANFFDNHHFVMKGGSPRTASCMLRRTFRNWFQPHYPHVYAGFRCVSH
jgi:gamma-glutamyl hercynylcysteine S-oxide synthase